MSKAASDGFRESPDSNEGAGESDPFTGNAEDHAAEETRRRIELVEWVDSVLGLNGTELELALDDAVKRFGKSRGALKRVIRARRSEGRDLVGMDVELLRKCASVLSPWMAAIVTFALKAGVWFRRGRRFMVSPDSQAPACHCQAEIPLIALCKIPEPLRDITCGLCTPSCGHWFSLRLPDRQSRNAQGSFRPSSPRSASAA
jgi:hypothetical protein